MDGRVTHDAGGAVTIRAAELSDVDALIEIEHEVFPTDRLNHKALRRSLRSPTISVLAAVQDGSAIGYALLHRRRGSSVVHLASIAVAAAAAGKGLGRRLLEVAEREAARHGARRVRLEARPDNEAARALYAGAGYRRFAVIEEYYSDGTPAWRYEKQLDRAEG
jgi:ribosomal-protein-alanine N-acetyltransferase